MKPPAQRVPLISVIIPTYNRTKETLQRAVHSVLTQTLRDLECIVVDDGSQPCTAGFLTDAKDDRLRLICHASNKGASVARNTGIRAAKGQWIAYLDSDDEWLPTKLAEQLTVLRPDIRCISYCRATVAQPDGSERHRPEKPWDAGCLLEYLVADGGFIQTSGLVHHSSLALDFHQEMFPFDDWDWLMRQTANGAILTFLPAVLYRYHQDALDRAPSYSGRPLMEQAMPFITRHAKNFSRSPRSLEQLRYGCVSHAVSTGRRWQALKILYAIAQSNHYSINKKFLRFLIRILTPTIAIKFFAQQIGKNT